MDEVLEADIESRRIDIAVDGEESVGIRYLTAGEDNADEPPVVLLHGIGLDAASVSWKHALPYLARENWVLAPDFPGHGESDTAKRYTTDHYINVLDGLLDALAVDTVRLVGISMGGAVALGYALDNRAVSRLILVDSYGLGRDAPWRPGGSALVRTPGFDGLLGAGFALNPAVVTASLAGVVVNGSDGFVTDVQRAVGPRAARALGEWQRDEFRACGLRTCYLDRLNELQAPTLLIHGREDPIFPIAWSERATERIPESEFAPFERCGHWPPREYPEKFNRVVSEFL